MSTRKFFLDQIKQFGNCKYKYRRLKLKVPLQYREGPKNFTRAVPFLLSEPCLFLQCKCALTD